MKRCPHCEFIYEDDQNLCDMDGRTLVHDRAITVLQSPISSKPIPRTPWLNAITLPACAGLLLAALLSVGYHISANSLNTKTETGAAPPPIQEALNTPRPDPSPSKHTVSASAVDPVILPPAESAPPAKPSQVAENSITDNLAHKRSAVRDQRFTVARSVSSLPRLRPLPRLPEAKPLEKKKDSKVGSFLKKTGRILTKPFKR